LQIRDSGKMARIINKKIRFLRWLNSGMIIPFIIMAASSSIILYGVLFILIK
jgi:hypothetical protein